MQRLALRLARALDDLCVGFTRRRQLQAMTVCAVYQGGVVVARLVVRPCDRLERLSSHAV